MATGWSLPSLAVDPEPTQAEIEDELCRLGSRGRDDIRVALARMQWKLRRREADPDAFLVPFVTDEKEYNRYQKSSVWQKIRQRVLQMARGRCRCCGAAAREVHHRDYRPRVLAGNDSAALVAVCAACHHLIHHSTDGKRRKSWNDSEHVLGELVLRHALSVLNG